MSIPSTPPRSSSAESAFDDSPSNTARRPNLRPELLAPVGSWAALDAALSAGADALYLGLDEGFHARAKTQGFSRQSLGEAVQRAHRAHAKVYVTLNTLVFESELEVVVDLIRGIARAGVDALIVQDPAVARIARQVAPSLELHASTQMTICSPEAARFAKKLGISRVVVPRELSLAQIRKFAEDSSMELEVFVHGALCMSWSGQCLSGEAWLGRSANRGQCNQGCRLPYDLIVDGQAADTGAQFWLSPQDLMALPQLEELAKIGVASLKIEGRYKGAGYVEQNVALYRAQIDQRLDDEQRERGLATSALEFSRGFGPGHLLGSRHQDLVEGSTSDHRGIFLGRVQKHQGTRVWIELAPDPASTSQPPKQPARRHLPVLSNPSRPRPPKVQAGMGVVIGEGSATTGGRIYRVIRPPSKASAGSNKSDPNNFFEEEQSLILDLGSRATGLEASQNRAQNLNLTGQPVWLNSQAPGHKARPDRKSAARDFPFAVDLRIEGQAGAPLEVELYWPPSKLRLRIQSDQVLQSARAQGIDETMLRDKLGGGELKLGRLDTTGLATQLFLPPSQLKALKRDLLDSLKQNLARHHDARVKDQRPAAQVLETLRSNDLSQEARERPDPLSSPSVPTPSPAPAPATVPSPTPAPDPHAVKETKSPRRWVVLCRNDAQLQACIDAGATEVDLDWMEFIGLKAAVQKAKAAGLVVNIATVRVQKPGEEGYDRRIEALQPDGVLLRHLGAVMHFARIPAAKRPTLHGDFSLNVCNSLSAQVLLDLGLSTLSAAHDLDLAQVLALQQSLPTLPLTITLHHHLPLFHNDHCVYAQHLSDGQDFRTCKRPCDHHRIHLRDHQGHEHPVIVDVECRNTVFNAKAQSAARAFGPLINAGIRAFRIEFAWESYDEALKVLRLYRRLDEQELAADAVLKALAVSERFGVSLGTLAQRRSSPL